VIASLQLPAAQRGEVAAVAGATAAAALAEIEARPISQEGVGTAPAAAGGRALTRERKLVEHRPIPVKTLGRAGKTARQNDACLGAFRPPVVSRGGVSPKREF